MKKIMYVAALAFISSIVWAEEPVYPGQKAEWKGFVMYKERGSMIVVPKEVKEGKPWVWRARFWGHEPQFDIAMLNKGYHVVFRDVGNLFGNPVAVERWDEFYKKLTDEHGFSKKPILEGFSRGGFIIYNWAAKNPDKVGAMYGDAPVMDFKSWPGINAGIIRAYGFKDKAEGEAYKLNPVDNLAPIAKAKIPIIHVVGDADKTVPVSENTAVAEKRYKELGGLFEVIHKPGVDHHPHSLKDPAPIVEFMTKHAL